MARRKSHTKTTYLVKRDNLPTINFTLRDNERPAPGKYLDPLDPETWRPVDLTGKNLTGWFKEMCVNGRILFGIPVLRHAPFTDGKCTLLGQPSVLMDITPGWYELEIEVHTCATSYKQTVWKRFKFCIREDFDTSETDGMNAPIYRDANGVLQELPVNPPDCGILYEDSLADVVLTTAVSQYTYSGTATDVDGLVVDVQWRMDEGTWMSATNTGHQFSTWEFTVTNIDYGKHVIEVRAIDENGNASVLDSCMISRLNNTPPTLTIDCGTSGPAESPSACFADIDRGNIDNFEDIDLT